MVNAAVNFKVMSKQYTTKLTHVSCEAQGRNNMSKQVMKVSSIPTPEFPEDLLLSQKKTRRECEQLNWKELKPFPVEFKLQGNLFLFTPHRWNNSNILARATRYSRNGPPSEPGLNNQT